MKNNVFNYLIIMFTMIGVSVNAQQSNFANNKVIDSSGNMEVTTGNTSNHGSKIQLMAPAISFNEHPINHNMHITADGDFYYTINGGSAGSGQINKFTQTGTLLQTYPILIDGRGLSYNSADGFLYASLYGRDIVKITDLNTGTYITVFPTIMQNDQASFAISPDGSKFYNFFQGTLYIHDFNSGAILDTISGLSYGFGNFGGEAAVAVDSSHIYTIEAGIKTVYTYDLYGNFIQTTVLDSGDNGMALAIANGYLFFAKDGNYNIGTWYGYNLSGSTGTGPDFNYETQYEIYPNPTTDKVRINGNADAIEIYNMLGKLIYSKANLVPTDEINLSDIPKGIYFIRIRDKAMSVDRKIVVQ